MKSITCERAISIVMSIDSHVHDVNELQTAQQHVLHCPRCASLADEPELISLSPQRDTLSSILRLSLWLVGLLQLLIALPWIFGATPLWDPANSAAESHLTRDGVLGVLFALAALVVAWSPRLSYFVLPACLVLLIIQLTALIVDQQTDLVHVQFESVHLLTLVITTLVVISVLVSRKRALQGFRGAPSKSRNTDAKKRLTLG